MIIIGDDGEFKLYHEIIAINFFFVGTDHGRH